MKLLSTFLLGIFIFQISFLFAQFGKLQEISPATAYRGKAVLPCDLDNDGDLDIIAITDFGRITTYTNLGSGKFSSQQFVGSTLEGMHTVIYAVDLDLDGDMDLITASEFSQFGDAVSWYENIGGVLSVHHYISTGPDGVTSICAADMDGDSDIDVVYATPNDNEIAWYKNLGGANFGTRIKINGTSNYPHSVCTADLDADGDQDIVAVSDANQVSWYKNSGTGTFTNLPLSFTISGASRVSTEDIDGDGDIDVLATSTTLDRLYWFENPGTGYYIATVPLIEHIITNNANDPTWVTSTDLDGDGDPDVLSASYQDDKIAWYENTGGGNFGPQNIITTLADGAYMVSVGDLDNDGDMDVLSAAEWANEIALFRNYFNSPYKLKGRMFFDENQNRKIDVNEKGFLGVKAELTSTVQQNFSDVAGNYYFATDTGNYEILSQNFPDWGKTTDTVYVGNLSVATPVIDTLHFGYYPVNIYDSLVPRLSGGFPRCSNAMIYSVSLKNAGTTRPSGIIQVMLDNDINYIPGSASIMPDSVIGKNLFWHFDSLLYFTEKRIDFTVLMPGFSLMGDTLKSIFKSTILDMNGNPVKIFQDTVPQVLRCAYDPNDKTVYPKGTGANGYVSENEELEYLIRFQNTGNDTAINIVITDQLDAQLDWSTFHPVTSSHQPMSASIDIDGEVVFRFDNILLPDSNINEPASHGFVRYGIKPKTGILPNVVISNFANIYFDSNPAIVTDTVSNTIECSAPYIDRDTLVVAVCSTYTWAVNGQTYTNTGLYEKKLLNKFGCDSASYLDLAILNNAGSETVALCDSFMWGANGTTYYSTGTYQYTLMNQHGCDSAVTLNLTIHNNSGTETASACDSYTWPLNSENYTSSGTYKDTLLNTFGCDSIITLNLTVNKSTVSSINADVCEQYTWSVNNQMYTTSGTYNDTIANQSGCDSILTLNLTVRPVSFIFDTAVACNFYTWQVNGQTYTSNGVYSDTLVNFLGCDSILSINLTVDTVDAEVIVVDAITLKAVSSSAGYRWLDCNDNYAGIAGETAQIFAATANGDYAVEVTDNGCKDTSACVAITTIGAFEYSLEEEIRIYPNPCQDVININLGSIKEMSFKVMDLNGKIIQQVTNVNGPSFSFELKAAPGIYFIELTTPKGNIRKKLVKE